MQHQTKIAAKGFIGASMESLILFGITLVSFVDSRIGILGFLVYVMCNLE